jgi:septal ring factor EnvC (AmiA/AmiB activator)
MLYHIPSPNPKYITFYLICILDGTSAGQMAQNEMLEMHRDIAGLRQELKILHMERNKFNIEIQKCQMEITQLKEKNKKMNKSLEAQTDTINLIKRQVLME